MISGNTDNGIVIQDRDTTGNMVVGNFIGTNQAGDAPLANPFGVVISFGAVANVIGARQRHLGQHVRRRRDRRRGHDGQSGGG